MNKATEDEILKKAQDIKKRRIEARRRLDRKYFVASASTVYGAAAPECSAHPNQCGATYQCCHASDGGCCDLPLQHKGPHRITDEWHKGQSYFWLHPGDNGMLDQTVRMSGEEYKAERRGR